MKAEMEAEFVIIGAGSAGSAIAYRLAEAGSRVLVIEHGGKRYRSPSSRCPRHSPIR